MNHRFIVVLCLFLLGSNPAAPEFSLEGDIRAQLELDVSRIENAALRHKGKACVTGWMWVTQANGKEFQVATEGECTQFHGRWAKFWRVDSSLDEDLRIRAERAAQRIVSTAGKWDALVCFDLTVDFVDKWGRLGNFTQTDCWYS